MFRCLPPQDEISDCEDLMSNAAQRSFLWVLGIVALLGNTSVIIWRYRNIFVSPVSSTLILSLGCADFFMGVYLLIIASVDVHYRLGTIQLVRMHRRGKGSKNRNFLRTY